MAKLNVYLPDELYRLADKWRGRVNLSEVCARALREEFNAVENSRSAYRVSSLVRSSSKIERQLIKQFNLTEVIVCDIDDPSHLREDLGMHAASYLDGYLCDDSLLAVAGGRQMWCMVRNLVPRRVKVVITALGIEQNDPQVLHAHANTLITLLWLLYGPRSSAHLVGSSEFEGLWGVDSPVYDHPKFFVVASCGPFGPQAPLARLLGANESKSLSKLGVCGDYAYQFFMDDGNLIPNNLLTQQHSILAADKLRALSLRPDSRVVLLAGGREKITVMKYALKSRLCNVLITDSDSASELIREQ